MDKQSTQDVPLLSVIMPVYNSERYLPGAVESILEQSFQDFELLLVDDGSPDGSGALCDRYAAADPRVRVFHLENGGMCRARNIALGHARGTYVGFCDNDDAYVPGAFEQVAQAASENPDVVQYGRTIKAFDPDGNFLRETSTFPAESCLAGSAEFFDRYRLWSSGDGVWVRFYRREFLDQHRLRFDERLRNGGEDILFNAQCAEHAPSVSYLAEPLYLYYVRASHSTSAKVSEASIDNRCLGIGLAVDTIHRTLMAHGLDKTQPEVFAWRFGSLLTNQVVGAPNMGNADFSTERYFYCGLYVVYGPFLEQLLKMPLAVPYRVVLALFSHQQWRALFNLACVWAAFALTRANVQRLARRS